MCWKNVGNIYFKGYVELFLFFYFKRNDGRHKGKREATF